MNETLTTTARSIDPQAWAIYDALPKDHPNRDHFVERSLFIAQQMLDQATPVPPWYQAQSGQVWILQFNDDRPIYAYGVLERSYVNLFVELKNFSTTIEVTNPAITSAYCLWSEHRIFDKLAFETAVRADERERIVNELQQYRKGFIKKIKGFIDYERNKAALTGQANGILFATEHIEKLSNWSTK